jgi:polyisoprenyl-phosphate glycosyltransferase
VTAVGSEADDVSKLAMAAERGSALVPTYSLVVPAYNEEGVIGELAARLTEVMDALDGDAEAILVDDGSRDRTYELMLVAAQEEPRLRLIRLSRNFGHQIALTAGVDLAAGDAVIVLDADLQDPPEVILRLLEQWEAGADVVHGVRHERRGESRRRLFVIRGFYRVFDRLSGLPNFPGHSGDFRLISRPALDALNALPERNRFVRGLISWVGFRQVSVVYERDARFAGSSKYPLRKLLSLAANGILSFSALPLRAAAWLGLVMSITAFAAIPVVVILRLAGLYDVSGIASIHILVLLVGGIQLLFLGVIGEYLARDYDETKRRPVYILGEAPPAEEQA